MMRLLLVALLVLSAVPAQVPPRATILNPTGGFFGVYAARSGNTVHTCGIAGAPLGPGFVHYGRSTDGGRTWPLLEVPIAYARELNGIQADGDLVVAVVNSRFFGPHSITSTDGGMTWALPVRVSQTAAPGNLAGVAFALRGTTVGVIWYEDRALGRMWFNQSTDGGFTWRANDTALDIGLPSGGLPLGSLTLRLFLDGPVLTALWTHWSTAGDVIAQQRSVDGGQTWMPTAGTIGPGALEAVDGDGPLIVASAQNSPTVWRSTNSGASWSAVAGHGVTDPLFVAVDDSTVMVLGYTGTNSLSLIEANVSADGGATWQPTPFSRQYSWLTSARPAVGGDNAFVQMFFLTPFPPDGAVFHSGDAGANWRRLSGEAGRSIIPSADSCLVTTKLNSSGDQIYIYVITGHTTVGSGTPGTGGIVPKLAGRGLPPLGGTFALEVSAARGGATGVLGIAFAQPVHVPLGAATLHLQQTAVASWFVTGGTAGAAGVGTFALPVTVPSNTSFVDLPFVSQAFILDPVAASGCAATGAVETWIR